MPSTLHASNLRNRVSKDTSPRQLSITTLVENFPAGPGHPGPRAHWNMKKQARARRRVSMRPSSAPSILPRNIHLRSNRHETITPVRLIIALAAKRLSWINLKRSRR